MSTLRYAMAACAIIASAQAAEAAKLMGLTADNGLVSIDTESRRASGAVPITGTDGRVLGIDQRPQDGRLYGVTERGQIVRIDGISGAATQVSRLNMPFDGGGRAVVDFNPVANRLRLMGMNGTNFRVNIETGEVVRDGTLKYMDGSPQSGTTPRVTAGAYTNSMVASVPPVAGAPAPTTALYTLDTLLGSFNLQAPPNDGVQQIKGMLGMSVPNSVGFDILSDDAGGNMGMVLAAGTLHSIDLTTGALTTLGPIGGMPAAEVIDIAAMR